MSDAKKEGIAESDLKLIMDFVKRAKAADEEAGGSG
jgi:hypothetical protein